MYKQYIFQIKPKLCTEQHASQQARNIMSNEPILFSIGWGYHLSGNTITNIFHTWETVRSGLGWAVALAAAAAAASAVWWIGKERENTVHSHFSSQRGSPKAVPPTGVGSQRAFCRAEGFSHNK